jgi:hypothetical protein
MQKTDNYLFQFLHGEVLPVGTGIIESVFPDIIQHALRQQLPCAAECQQTPHLGRGNVHNIISDQNHFRAKGRELLHLPKETVMRNCNGIGPEWFPDKLRNFITWLNPRQKATAAIHDMMYACGHDFSRANDIFAINGKWEAVAAYKWYSPRRYIAIAKAQIFAKLCQKFGYMAWKSAQRKMKR